MYMHKCVGIYAHAQEVTTSCYPQEEDLSPWKQHFSLSCIRLDCLTSESQGPSKTVITTHHDN